jgi:hypothetical protein
MVDGNLKKEKKNDFKKKLILKQHKKLREFEVQFKGGAARCAAFFLSAALDSRCDIYFDFWPIFNQLPFQANQSSAPPSHHPASIKYRVWS